MNGQKILVRAGYGSRMPLIIVRILRLIIFGAATLAAIEHFYCFTDHGQQREIMAGSSSAGMVDHSFDLQVGVGIQIKLSDRFSLQLIPPEYDLAILSSGATHSFTANAGTSWTLWRQKMPRINFFAYQLHHAQRRK